MALAATLLTSAYDSVNRALYTTASVAPSDNALVLLIVNTPEDTLNATPPIPTVSGGGMTTWTQEVDFTWDTIGTTRGRMQIFRALEATPGTATATIDYGAVTVLGCAWAIVEFTGVDTSGTNGDGATVQSATTTADAAAATSATVTLAAFGSANNAAFGAFAHRANEATTFGTGFTELSDVFGSAPTWALQTEWKVNDTTVDASWTTSSLHGAITLEIKEAVGGTTVTFDALIAGTGVVVADTVRQRALEAVITGTAIVISQADATRLFEMAAAGQATIIATLDLPAGGGQVIVVADTFTPIYYHYYA